MVFVLSYECIVLSSEYDTFRLLLMQLLRAHHLLERGLISESINQFTNQDETNVALIFGKSSKLVYFCGSEMKKLNLNANILKCQDWHNAIMW